jgi:ring-1,2-phenylacetyl-CoA epoxidase subunit PaaC
MNNHVAPRSTRLLILADTCLLWGHRLPEWCGHGPALEEDIAMTNTALDLMGHARSLYQLHASHVGGETTEDTLAYFRDADDFQNIPLAEAENGDYAHTILRSLMLCLWFDTLWRQLTDCDDAELSAIAREAAKSNAVALRHASEWTVRFGDGTAESRQRIENAIDALMPYYPALISVEIEGTDSALRAERWHAGMRETLDDATLPPQAFSLSHPLGHEPIDRGVRRKLLAEMQSLARQHPGASW